MYSAGQLGKVKEIFISTTLLHGAVQRQGVNVPFPLDKGVGAGLNGFMGWGMDEL